MLILLTHFFPRPTESDPLNDSDNRQGHTVNLIFLFVCLELKLYIRELILKESFRNNLKLLVIFTQFNCQLSYLKINSLLDIFFPCFFFNSQSLVLFGLIVPLFCCGILGNLSWGGEEPLCPWFGTSFYYLDINFLWRWTSNKWTIILNKSSNKFSLTIKCAG